MVTKTPSLAATNVLVSESNSTAPAWVIETNSPVFFLPPPQEATETTTANEAKILSNLVVFIVL